MSTKLLKRLLQQTNEANYSGSIEGTRDDAKRQRRTDEDLQPLEGEELIDWQVQSMLQLDDKMAVGGIRQKESLKRISAKHKRESKLQKKSTSNVVGNSRAASSQLRMRPERTSNKKKYEKKKEEKKLKRIAKLLKKTKRVKF